MEIWKDIEGYEGLYQVSNLGRIRSLDRIDSNGRKRRGKIIKLLNKGKGYIGVGLHLDGLLIQHYVHRHDMERLAGLADGHALRGLGAGGPQ